MIIEVRAYAGSKQKKVEIVNSSYRVYVHEKAADGKANEAIIALLSEYFGTAKSNILLKRGEKGRTKTFEIVN